MLEFIITLISYIILEGTYLSLTFKSLYNPVFTDIQCNIEPKYNRYYGGIIAYVCIILAWINFIYFPMLSELKLSKVIINSTLLALAVYGVYNGTNLITFDKYYFNVAIRDILWSIFIFNIVSIICFLYLKNAK
jgi:uncharacterized membrane protein